MIELEHDQIPQSLADGIHEFAAFRHLYAPLRIQLMLVNQRGEFFERIGISRPQRIDVDEDKYSFMTLMPYRHIKMI